MTFRRLVSVFKSPFVAPALLVLLSTNSRNYIWSDIDRWSSVVDGAAPAGPRGRWVAFCKHMIRFPEFRSLFYYRVPVARLLSFLLKPMPTLYITTPDIGPGLFIQHGFATVISARRIGRNCWINQQVTIGYSGPDAAPTIGDDVTINAGAKVIGAIEVGSNSKVGAGSVVVKDVPPDSVVVGVPARVVRQSGVRIAAAQREML